MPKMTWQLYKSFKFPKNTVFFGSPPLSVGLLLLVIEKIPDLDVALVFGFLVPMHSIAGHSFGYWFFFSMHFITVH